MLLGHSSGSDLSWECISAQSMVNLHLCEGSKAEQYTHFWSKMMPSYECIVDGWQIFANQYTVYLNLQGSNCF